MPNLQAFSGALFKAGIYNNAYILLASSGIVFVHKDTLEELTYLTYSGVFTDVYIPEKSGYFFIGTSGNGVLRCDVPEEITLSLDLSNSLSIHKIYPELLSNIVTCIDGSESNLAIGTVSGIDVYRGNTRNSNNLLYPVSATSITHSEVYYSGQFGLSCKKYPLTNNWTPTYTLTSGTLPKIPGNVINSIDILTGSSNLIGVATNSGVVIIEESLPISGSIHIQTESGNEIDKLSLQLGSSTTSGSVILSHSGNGIKVLNLGTLNYESHLLVPTLVSNTVVDFI